MNSVGSSLGYALYRVIDNAQKYEVYSEHRVFMIMKCCTFLEKLMKDERRFIWPQNQRKPIEEFQDAMQLLICSICDDNFLFDDAEYFREQPNTEIWLYLKWLSRIASY